MREERYENDDVISWFWPGCAEAGCIIWKKSNDYGQGFYCTESEELAGEWACPGEKDGIFNRYRLETDGLRIFRLNGEVDDSYFSFVKDFLNNRISLEQLRQALLENRL